MVDDYVFGFALRQQGGGIARLAWRPRRLRLVSWASAMRASSACSNARPQSDIPVIEQHKRAVREISPPTCPGRASADPGRLPHTRARDRGRAGHAPGGKLVIDHELQPIGKGSLIARKRYQVHCPVTVVLDVNDDA